MDKTVAIGVYGIDASIGLKISRYYALGEMESLDWDIISRSNVPSDKLRDIISLVCGSRAPVVLKDEAFLNRLDMFCNEVVNTIDFRPEMSHERAISLGVFQCIDNIPVGFLAWVSQSKPGVIHRLEIISDYSTNTDNSTYYRFCNHQINILKTMDPSTSIKH